MKDGFFGVRFSVFGHKIGLRRIAELLAFSAKSIYGFAEAPVLVIIYNFLYVHISSVWQEKTYRKTV